MSRTSPSTLRFHSITETTGRMECSYDFGERDRKCNILGLCAWGESLTALSRLSLIHWDVNCIVNMRISLTTYLLMFRESI